MQQPVRSGSSSSSRDSDSGFTGRKRKVCTLMQHFVIAAEHSRAFSTPPAPVSDDAFCTLCEGAWLLFIIAIYNRIPSRDECFLPCGIETCACLLCGLLSLRPYIGLTVSDTLLIYYTNLALLLQRERKVNVICSRWSTATEHFESSWRSFGPVLKGKGNRQVYV